MNFYKVRYKFFLIVPRNVPEVSWFKKMLTDVESRICNVQGNTIKEAIDRIKQDYFDTQLNNWSVWTPAQEKILSSSLPPPSVNVVTLGGTWWRNHVDKTEKACKFLFDSIIISSDLDEGGFILLVNLSVLESPSRTRIPKSAHAISIK